MNTTTVTIGIIGAIMAGLAQALAHQVAQHYHWKRIPRYVTGITIINAAFAPCVFYALPLEHAAIIYGLLWLVTGFSGLATWISYEFDPKPGGAVSRGDLEKWAEAIAAEHDDAA